MDERTDRPSAHLSIIRPKQAILCRHPHTSFRADLRADPLTGLIDFDLAPVGDLLQQPEEGGLEVAQARALIAGPDVIDADLAAGQRRAHQPLPESLTALELQHDVVG